MLKISRNEGLQELAFGEYRKTATVKLAFVGQPFQIETKEGLLTVDESQAEWEDGYFLALPPDGDPYPISPKFVRENYEPV